MYKKNREFFSKLIDNIKIRSLPAIVPDCVSKFHKGFSTTLKLEMKILKIIKGTLKRLQKSIRLHVEHSTTKI